MRVVRLTALLPWAVAPLFMAGCVSTSEQQAAFAPVASDVAVLSGQRVVWNQDIDTDKLVTDETWQRLKTPLDANAAAQIALLNSPDLQATLEEIGISQADVVQAGMMKNPVIAASWRLPNMGAAIADTEYSIAGDFLSAVLIPLRIKVARQNLDATRARVTHQVIQLIAETKMTFYAYQADLQLESRLKLILDADQAGADLAQKQQQSGNLNKLGMLNQEAQVGSAQIAIAAAQKQKITDREKLNRLMGLSMAAIVWTAKPEFPPLPAHDLGTAQAQLIAIDQRRDLQALRAETDAVGQAFALKSNTRFLPASITIGADTEREEDRRISGPTAELELPIFDQGQGEVAKLAAQHRQLQRRLQSLSVQVQSEAREASRMMFIDRQQAELFKKTVLPLNIQTVNQTLEQYNAMQINTYDLFLAKQRELEAERDYIGAWRDYWVAHAELEEAVGGNLEPKKQP